MLEKATGHPINFCQDNLAKSNFGVVRGLHYQLPPYAQSKLVSVIHGRVLDVVVDMRVNSRNFGKHISIELGGENLNQLFIPRGFAHGYSCLTSSAKFIYKVDNFYNKQSEKSIAFNDPVLNIDWRIPPKKLVVSQKDNNQPNFNDAEPFEIKTSLYDY